MTQMPVLRHTRSTQCLTEAVLTPTITHRCIKYNRCTRFPMAVLSIRPRQCQ